MTGLAMWSTGRCPWNLNLTIRTNIIFTAQQLSKKWQTVNILLEFNIQTDHLISARIPDLIWSTKKELEKFCTFAVPASERIKLKEGEKKGKYLDLAWVLKKVWNMKVTIIPIVIGSFWYNNQINIERTGGFGIDDEWRLFKLLALLRTARY